MPKTIDLFAGCGGLSLGFEKAGFEIVAAFDNWEAAIDTFRANFKNKDVYVMDLGDQNPNIEIFKKYEPEIIIGGPPCQDFSSAGKRDENLGRADLTICFARTVATVKPKYFVMENVDRILKSFTLKRTMNILKLADYGLTSTILDASYYGVPQIRKRFFLIGELYGVDNSLSPYLDIRLSKKRLTVREYLGSKIDTEYYYRHPWSYARRAVFSIDEPSPTIRGVNRPIPEGYKGHPGDPVPISEKVRPLSTFERSLIQTFPENFIWKGSKTEVEQLIGNAVPVKLAEFVASCLKLHMSEKSK